MKKIIAQSAEETQEIAKGLAKEILQKKPVNQAVILCLSGELGSGKTTFVQGFAKGLGIKEKILSPTFNIMKRFKLNHSRFKNFYHFDCYRIINADEILNLGFKEITSNPENITAIEWSERISEIIPGHITRLHFQHRKNGGRTLIIHKYK